MKDRLTDRKEAQVSSESQVEKLSIIQIADIYQKPWTWVVRRLVPLREYIQISPSIRNIEDLQVPVGVLSLIDDVATTNIPAEDWLATTEIADELEVDYKWVNRRLLQLTNPGEYRIHNAVNRSGLHLHPDALEELKATRDSVAKELDPENYFHLGQLSAILRRHRLWILNRLEKTDFEAVIGFEKSGRAIGYYSRQILDYLTIEAAKYEHNIDHMTIPMLAIVAGKDREWVISQLNSLGIVGDYKRFPESGRVDLCYDPHVAIILQRRTERYKISKPGWQTENAIQNIVGRSHNWVHRRLAQLDTIPKLMPDTTGALRKHFSPKTVQQLIDMSEGWNIVDALEIEDDTSSEDSAAKFRDVYRSTNGTISLNKLQKIGVSEQELSMWMESNLITRWNSGQFCFTKKAQQVVDNMDLTEKTTRILNEMRAWLED